MPLVPDSVNSNASARVLGELWQELLNEQGTCRGRVVSDSMRPMLRAGDQVLVDKAPPDEVRFGDVVVFRRAGELVIHRVLGKRQVRGQWYFLEKGDATLASSLVPAQDIVGRVSRIQNRRKTTHIISGSGRMLQLGLALQSYASLRLWALLEYCLTYGRRTTCKRRYTRVYGRLCSWLRRIMLLSFSWSDMIRTRRE